MTIQAPTARVSFPCDSVSNVFPVNIQAYLATDFLVLLTNAAGSTKLNLNSDYTLVTSGSLSPPFWSLTTQTGQLVSPYVTGNTLQVILNPSETQLTQYTQGQAFPSLAVQTNLDRLTQMVIREGDFLSRAIVAPDGDVNPVMTLPSAKIRASTYPAFDVNGNLIFPASNPLPGTTSASLVNYTPPGTGAVPTTVAAKLAQTVSVFDFMTAAQQNNVAIGAGTIDVTAAWQVAATALGAIGGTVRVPAGSHLIAGSVTTTAPILFLGDGCGASIITTNSATANTITFNGASSGLQHIGFVSSVTRTTGAYIFLGAGANFSHVKNFAMNGYGIGIVTNGGVTQWFSEGSMFGPAANGIGFQALNNGNDIYLRNITMSANSLVSTAVGINLVYTGAVNITDCDIIRHGQDLLLNPGNGQVVVDVYALNTYFDTASNGVNINPSGTGLVQGLRMLGCWASAHTGNGVIIQGSGTVTGIRIVDLQCYSNGANGITVQNGSDVHILGGVYAGHVAGSGVSIAANISAFSIIGIRAGNADNKPANVNGITIAAGSSNQYVIVGNDLTGNTTNGLVDGGTGTVKVIRGNLQAVVGATSPITVGASPFTYTAGPLPETVYITSGTVSSVSVNGTAVFVATNCTVAVQPNYTVVVVYTVIPFMNKTIHSV